MSTKGGSTDRKARIARAIERIKTWMQTHGASVLVDNLEEGASAERLDTFETKIGAALPPDLRALWSIHAGQSEEQDGFVGAMDLLGPEEALGERESLMMFLGFLREEPKSWAEAGVSKEEVTSDAWLTIAARGYADSLVVNLLSGRVFTCEKDAPPFHLVAGSILEWIETYADRVERGEYTVEEGFGECYLAREDGMF